MEFRIAEMSEISWFTKNHDEGSYDNYIFGYVTDGTTKVWLWHVKTNDHWRVSEIVNDCSRGIIIERLQFDAITRAMLILDNHNRSEKGTPTP